MIAQVKTQREFLILQPLLRVPTRYLRGARSRGAFRELSKKADLICGTACLLCAFERGADHGEESRAMAVERVEGAGTNQRFDDAPVHQPVVHAVAEVEQVRERPALSC